MSAANRDWAKAEFHDLIIVGSGPAGSTAALYSARAGYRPIVFHGGQPGGQLTGTTAIENFPAWTGTGPDLVMAMEKQATTAGATYVFENITEVDLNVNPKHLVSDSGKLYTCNALIIATGANATYLGLENEKRLFNKGVSGCATCDGPLYKGKDVCVVGGGDAAAEEALFLAHICKSVKLIHRRDQLRASAPMRQRIASSSIQMIWNTVVTDILGSDHVTGIKVKDVKTNVESEIPCEAVFIAVGHTPATAIFRSFLECDQMGYFVTKDGTPATRIPGVFAAGDCADKAYRQAITSAGTGCQAALLAERYLQSLQH